MGDERCDLLCLDLPHAERVRATLPAAAAARDAAGRAKALADPSRLRVALALAAGGELCVCDLAWITGLAQNLVSHHLRALSRAGLAVARRDGRLVMYRLTPAGSALLAAVTATTGPDSSAGTAAAVAAAVDGSAAAGKVNSRG